MVVCKAPGVTGKGKIRRIGIYQKIYADQLESTAMAQAKPKLLPARVVEYSVCPVGLNFATNESDFKEFIPLIAHSEDSFSMEGTGVDFVKGSKGAVTAMIQHWAEGDRYFARRK
jgi:hypothetical protein